VQPEAPSSISATQSWTWSARLNAHVDSRTIRLALLLLAVFWSAWLVLTIVDTDSLVPCLWPAGAFAAGLHLTSPRRARPHLLAASFALMLLAHVVAGVPWAVGLGFSASWTASAWVTRWVLVRGKDGRRAALLDSGDVAWLVGTITAASAVASAGCGLTAWLTGHGSPWWGALGAFGATAAALMILLPLFLDTLEFEPIAGSRERVITGLLTLGSTIAVFANGDAPLVVFGVMPMFAWIAFRGTLRDATVLLTAVGVLGVVMSEVLGLGPVHALTQRYGIAEELAHGVLQLFLLDCGLLLLPLSVVVTQQRMATSRADSEREKLARLVQSATGTAIIATGPDGRIVLFNPGAEAMLGYVSEEVVGELPDRFHPPEELRRQASRLRALPNVADISRASVAAAERNQLWRFRRKDGADRTMRTTLTTVPDERGGFGGYLITAEDVTEREDAQRALLLTLEHQRTAVERLRDLERVKGDFVSTVSHELRTPITSIIGYTELLADGELGELTLSQQEIVDRVDRNGRRLLLLVEDLLTLSQIESSVLKIEPVATDVRDVVARSHRAIVPTLANRSLEVALLVPTQPVVHDGDPVQLERMLVNLLTNAVKFTPDGGRVELQLRTVGDDTEIVVSDTGMGIPEDEQAKLFTRFFRSTTATQRAIQGTGLGLTIVKAIVALHGGRIEVDSTPGKGTTVTVTIPRCPMTAAVTRSVAG
jgi:PAS domain S-box-containing protein